MASPTVRISKEAFLRLDIGRMGLGRGTGKTQDLEKWLKNDSIVDLDVELGCDPDCNDAIMFPEGVVSGAPISLKWPIEPSSTGQYGLNPSRLLHRYNYSTDRRIFFKFL